MSTIGSVRKNKGKGEGWRERSHVGVGQRRGKGNPDHVFLAL